MAYHEKISLLPMGRCELRKGRPLRHWDLAAGIGTAFFAVIKSGLSYSDGGYYYACEVNELASGVFRGNLPHILADSPEQAPHPQTLECFGDSLPSNLFELARKARHILALIPDCELPTYVTSSVPCTESSKAGLAGGGETEKGKLYLCVIAVVWAVQLEYQIRGLGEPGVASVGWMYETSPTNDPRPKIRALREQLRVLLGEPANPDEATSGGTSRRVTELYTNLGRADTWPSLDSRLDRAPIVPLREILRRGEKLQTWDSRFHGPAKWPNRDGEVPRVYPKFVRSLGSHAWRAELIRRRLPTGQATRYPIGVSLLPDQEGVEQLVVPMPEQQEVALGFRAGYTSTTVSSDEQERELTSNERRGLLGDVFGMHVHAAAFQDRMQESQDPQCQDPLAALIPPGPPPGPPPEERAAASEEEAWGDAEFCLEEEFAAHEVGKPPKPPAKAERVRPLATTVPDPWPAGSPQEIKARKALRQTMLWLQARKEGRTVPEACLSPEDLERYIKDNLMLDDSQFEPSHIHRYRKIWREYLEETLGSEALKNNKKVREVLRLLDKGLEANWVSPDRPASQKHPEHEKRRAKVKRMMAKVMTAEQAEAKLNEPTPPRMHFPNLKSCYETVTWEDGTTTNNADFVTELVAKYTQNGILARWPWPEGEPPVCILPLGVATRILEVKQRGILDGRFINLWWEYIGFKYETMKDIINMAFPDGWATVSDYKSGYSHIATPELSKYMAVCWNGEVYYFTCCPFGVAVACRVFTVVNEVMFRPLREAGIRLSVYIDDRLSISVSQRAANLDALIQYAVMGMCGWFVNILKSLLSPTQLVTFTGLEVDFKRGRLTVPDKKLKFILKQVRRAIDRLPEIDMQELQSIAGRVGAVRLAVRVAPLLCRSLHKEAPAWMAALQHEPEAASQCLKQTLQFIVAHLEECNGSDFWEQPTGLVIAGDAGDMGSGSFVVWPKGLGIPPMQTSYTEQEMAGIADYSHHSTLREVVNVRSTAEWIAESEVLSQLARLGCALYLTDNRAACDAVMALSTKRKEVMDTTWQIWEMQRRHQFRLRVRWCSREDPRMKNADGHTREADEGAVGLKPKYYFKLLEDLSVDQSRVQLDPFSQKEFAKAPRWFSKYSAPGSAGVDGFLMPWTNEDGTKAFCFVNGQFKLMGQIIRKIEWEQTDCILIAPGWPKYWVSMLRDLPITRTVPITPEKFVTEGKQVQDSLFVRGSRAARGTTAYWKMYAHLVEFSTVKAKLEEPGDSALGHGFLGPMLRRTD